MFVLKNHYHHIDVIVMVFFCAKHRYYDKHHCTFDLRSLEIERLKQQLPLIVKDKVPNRI